jgi:hypothetical protein
MALPTYGPTWVAFRRWYFDHPRTIKFCVWCLTRPRPIRALQLNHLTYRMVNPDWPELWQVAPMCKRCHDWETWLTQRLFGEGRNRITPNAHYYVTFGAILVGWLPVLLVVGLLIGMVI